MKSELFINKKIWNAFTGAEWDEYVEKVFQFFRKTGFPHFELTEEKLKREIHDLYKFDTECIQEGDVLKQYMLGLRFCNYFMPHIWETKRRGNITPVDAFNDDKKLREAINKRMRTGDNISEAGLRKSLSWVSGAHRVSNFRPTVAKWVYDNFSGDGRVLDFSMGYGGRLFGAMCSKKVIQYVGADPCVKTFNGLVKIRNFIQDNCKSYIDLKHYVSADLINKPFEDLEFGENVFDLAFSSPPYFNMEEYDYDDTQSFVRYNTRERWRDKFLKVVIDKCYKYIKKDGNFLINVANVKTYKNLEEDTMILSQQAGFKFQKKYEMTLSRLHANSTYKYEPIFWFKK